MAQRLDGGFDRGLVDDPCSTSDGWFSPWLVGSVILAIGWGIFFGYAAVYLSEAPLQRPRHDPEQAEAHIAKSAFVLVPGMTMPDPPRPADAKLPSREPESSASPSGPATQEGVPAVQAANPVRIDAPASSTVAISRMPDPERADFVGLWGPTPAACHSPSRRDGYIRARITPEGARAGRTVCKFRESRRAGAAWIMAADCSDEDRRWSSQVRLTVEGDRLTWSSAKGASAYVRCGRRDG